MAASTGEVLDLLVDQKRKLEALRILPRQMLDALTTVDHVLCAVLDASARVQHLEHGQQTLELGLNRIQATVDTIRTITDCKHILIRECRLHTGSIKSRP
jgi:hypothetical protein